MIDIHILYYGWIQAWVLFYAKLIVMNEIVSFRYCGQCIACKIGNLLLVALTGEFVDRTSRIGVNNPSGEPPDYHR